ncbi:MAG: nuclease-related domain-containing protein, partial [Victivallaceae bacterium]
QIAYYLKHKFHADKNIFVINNLRFSRLGDYTQIDHLIVHEFGIIIVESKSVSSKVKYNEHEEWNRLWNNSWTSMDNPVKQAERQGDAVKALLSENCEKLRGKLLGLQKRFGSMQKDFLVAISNQCIKIERPLKNDPYQNIVVKADLITDRICQILSEYKKRNRLFSKEEPPWKLSLEETIRVKDFLLEQHEPLQAKQKQPAQAIPPPVEKSRSKYSPIPDKPVESTVKEEPAKYANTQPPEKEEKIHALLHCPECKGNVTIRWGEKYKNYYWHCLGCGKNTPIDHKCPGCQQKLKIRKQLKDFYIYCNPCKLEALYHSEK